MLAKMLQMCSTRDIPRHVHWFSLVGWCDRQVDYNCCWLY